MVLRRESRGGGRASGGTITTFHGKDKQFLSLVSSGDKITEMDYTGFQEVKSIGLNAQVKVDPGWGGCSAGATDRPSQWTTCPCYRHTQRWANILVLLHHISALHLTNQED